jgi:hypothetical protein
METADDITPGTGRASLLTTSVRTIVCDTNLALSPKGRLRQRGTQGNERPFATRQIAPLWRICRVSLSKACASVQSHLSPHAH